jgi:hypothetical protein
MNPKRVIVNFRHISAYKALANIVDQCGMGSVLSALGEIDEAYDENMPLPSSLGGTPVIYIDGEPFNHCPVTRSK